MLRHLVRTVNLFDTAKSALFLCFLTACHPSGGGNPVRGLVYYESYDPRSLDPSLATDVPTGEMIPLLLDRRPRGTAFCLSPTAPHHVPRRQTARRRRCEARAGARPESRDARRPGVAAPAHRRCRRLRRRSSA